jgi:hypothetical protein
VEDAAACQLSARVTVVATMWCAGQLEKKNGKIRGLLMVSVRPETYQGEYPR